MSDNTRNHEDPVTCGDLLGSPFRRARGTSFLGAIALAFGWSAVSSATPSVLS